VDFNINPRIGEQLARTAGAMIARKVAQQFSPTTIRKIQQLLQFGDFIDGLFGLSSPFEDFKQPLMGGMSLAEAKDIYQQLNDAQLSRKNLFFIRVTDFNPPPISYLDGTNPSAMFNLFATDASYGLNSLTGERVQIGSASMDKLTGAEQIDLSINTMDDSRGSIKRWFEGKLGQAAHTDGTFGLPSDYWVDFEIYHAVPTANEGAYKFNKRMRPVSLQLDQSRRDQAMQEVQLVFQQFDTFVTV
jgi:hypothetical protein